MEKMQECPCDPGGYFITRGTERVILIHEQLAKNRILVGMNSKQELQAEVLSSTEQKKSKTYVVSKRGRYFLRHNQLNDEVLVSIALKAMGIEADVEIVGMVGEEENIAVALVPTIEVSAPFYPHLRLKPVSSMFQRFYIHL